MKLSLRSVARWLCAGFFVAAGANHFRMPEMYLGIIPPMLPWPEALNAISGAAEIFGGLGLVVPATRRLAGWGLIALLVAVFPANVYAALIGRIPGLDLPVAVLWWRLPFQGLFVVWVWWVALARPSAVVKIAPAT